MKQTTRKTFWRLDSRPLLGDGRAITVRTMRRETHLVLLFGLIVAGIRRSRALVSGRDEAAPRHGASFSFDYAPPVLGLQLAHLAG